MLKIDMIEDYSWNLYDASEDNYENIDNALLWMLFRWAHNGNKPECLVIMLNSIFTDTKFYAEKISEKDLDINNRNIILGNNRTYFDIEDRKNILNQIIDIFKSKR